MKEVRRQTISVKDNPLFSAVRKACVVNTVTTFKIKKKEGEKERERENETLVTTIGKGSLRPSSAPPPWNRWNQWDEGAYWLNVHDRKRWMTAGGATSLSYDGESWNFTLNENNKYVEHKRRRCFLQEHCEALNWSAHARKAPLEYEWDLKKKKWERSK